MHPSAMANARAFFDCYFPSISSDAVKVVEIGSQNVNGSIREVCPESYEYIGLDFQEAPGVDIVLTDPYVLPLGDESVDVVVSSSCFEHSEMFWLVFIEILRVLKPRGLFYLNAPSNGVYHRYPVDCWRFYPDSGKALVTWARRNGISVALLESYTSEQVEDVWNDFVAVFLKDERYAEKFQNRIVKQRDDISNAYVYGMDELIKPTESPEDLRRLAVISHIRSVGHS
jgi:SAM-dependent methyltransferase